MAVLRALLYSVGVFAGLAIISLAVAGIMRLLYAIIHKEEKKPQGEEQKEAKSV